ncbi:MAG: hypothetical protein LBK95_09495 [Bifidobacteriaceae bacterium]|nr:hypothetical protein [Bifidobacteriaceae bacterium]
MIAIAAAGVVVLAAGAAILVSALRTHDKPADAGPEPTVQEEPTVPPTVSPTPSPTPSEPSASPSDQPEPVETVEDDRATAFEGTLHESTTLPLSFMLPPDYTVDENADRILATSPTGLAQVQVYRVAGVSAADVAADQEKYDLDAINRFNGNLYEFTSEEDVDYYGTTWHRVIFKSNDADGNLINYWLTYVDDGEGGVIFCATGLFFGSGGSVGVDELASLDVSQSMILD